MTGRVITGPCVGGPKDSEMLTVDAAFATIVDPVIENCVYFVEPLGGFHFFRYEHISISDALMMLINGYRQSRAGEVKPDPAPPPKPEPVKKLAKTFFSDAHVSGYPVDIGEFIGMPLHGPDTISIAGGDKGVVHATLAHDGSQSVSFSWEVAQELKSKKAELPPWPPWFSKAVKGHPVALTMEDGSVELYIIRNVEIEHDVYKLCDRIIVQLVPIKVKQAPHANIGKGAFQVGSDFYNLPSKNPVPTYQDVTIKEWGKGGVFSLGDFVSDSGSVKQDIADALAADMAKKIDESVMKDFSPGLIEWLKDTSVVEQVKDPKKVSKPKK